MLNSDVMLFDVTFFLHIQPGCIQIPFDLANNMSMVISTIRIFSDMTRFQSACGNQVAMAMRVTTQLDLISLTRHNPT